MRILSLILAGAALAACQTPIASANNEAASVETVAKNTAPNAWQKATFGPLADLVGKTFYGQPGGDSSEQMADIQAWDWSAGGAVISINHALEDGSYGGETLVYHDKAADALAYVYVTNAGFITQGTFTVSDDGSWTAEEAVKGHPTITKVRSTGSMNANGDLVSTSTYLSGEEWVPGHSFTYREVTDKAPVLNPPS